MQFPGWAPGRWHWLAGWLTLIFHYCPSFRVYPEGKDSCAVIFECWESKTNATSAKIVWSLWRPYVTMKVLLSKICGFLIKALKDFKQQMLWLIHPTCIDWQNVEQKHLKHDLVVCWLKLFVQSWRFFCFLFWYLLVLFAAPPGSWGGSPPRSQGHITRGYHLPHEERQGKKNTWTHSESTWK